MRTSSFFARILRRSRYETTMVTFDAIHRLGLSEPWLRARPGAQILAYHGLDQRGGSGFNTRFLDVRAFEKQVAWMRRHCRIVTLDEYFAGVRDPRRFTVCLTFDDGYATWLDLALPVLERYEVPCAFFITAIGAIEDDALWPDRLDIAMHQHRASITVRGEAFERRSWGREFVSSQSGVPLKARCKESDWEFIQDVLAAFPRETLRPLPQHLCAYWRMLDAEGLRRLAMSPLVTIGSHGVRHVTLPCQDPAVARAEMEVSKRWIEGVIGRSIRAMAFPNGAWNPATLSTAEEVGYTQLLGDDPADHAAAASPLLRGRMTMNPFISWANQVRCIYSGAYS